MVKIQVVSFLIFLKFNDTQCGFKNFSAEAAETLFPLQTIKGWTFDVEILALVKKMGYTKSSKSQSTGIINHKVK
jgi:dolichyl-phosphate beta-glucosyltransferase